MEIGLALPQYDYAVPAGDTLSWDAVAARARSAESLGFGSLWLSDHLFLSIEKYGGSTGDHFGYDPIVGLGALARATSDTGIGTLALCAQLRPPRLLLRQLQTLQELAPGRCTYAVGAGWFQPEYARAGIAFGSARTRLAQLAEVLDVLAALSPAAPRWAAGKGDRLLDVVAGHADGWNAAWTWTPVAYRDRLDALERACERVGRDPATVTRSLGLYTLVGEDDADLRRRFRHLQDSTPAGVVDRRSLEEWREGRLVGTVEQVREQVAAWRDLGVAVLIVGTGALPFTMTGADDLAVIASALVP